MQCDHYGCERRARTGKLCSSHYRRQRNGLDMESPVRRYRRKTEPKCKRDKPFEAERALLKELGLGDDH